MLYQLISDAVAWAYVDGLKAAVVLDQKGHSFPVDAASPPDSVELVRGRFSQLSQVPRCVSFGKPAFSGNSPAVKIVPRQSTNWKIQTGGHRLESLPKYEIADTRCAHHDACGAVMADVLTVDLQAKYTEPLQRGLVVICIGGGPPLSPRQRAREQLIRSGGLADSSAHEFDALRSEMEHGGPIYPRCTHGHVTSVKIDGEELFDQEVKHEASVWSNFPKCKHYHTNSTAKFVTVKSSCPITQVFAL